MRFERRAEDRTVCAGRRLYSTPRGRTEGRGSALAPVVGREGAQPHRPIQIVARPPNLAVLLIHCDHQLILRKISKFDATRCQILRLKCTKFDFRWGPNWGSLQLTLDPVAVFKGATSSGGRGERRNEQRGEGKRRGKVVKGKRGTRRGQPPRQYFGLEPSLPTKRTRRERKPGSC